MKRLIFFLLLNSLIYSCSPNPSRNKHESEENIVGLEHDDYPAQSEDEESEYNEEQNDSKENEEVEKSEDNEVYSDTEYNEEVDESDDKVEYYYSADIENHAKSEDNEDLEFAYSDGTFCAEVSYYNSNTGTNSSYTLTVEIESNEIIRINWPNGGWIDNDLFDPAELNEDGYSSFTSDAGYDFEVQITGKAADCFINVPMARQCIGITKKGNQCKNMTDNENGLCWHHQE